MAGRVLVVGAGILGCAIAGQLASHGVQVTLIDAGPAHPQASEGSLCWLNVASCRDPDYARLRIRSLEMWRSMAGHDPTCPVRFQGSIIWTTKPEATGPQIALMEQLGWPAEALDRAALREIFPDACNLPETAIFAPQEGTAHPAHIVAWVRADALAKGARIFRGNVIALDQTGGRVTGVTLRDGTCHTGDAVVLTAGRNTPELLAKLGIALPQKPGAGLVGWAEPTKRVVAHAVSSAEVDFWQDDTGRVLFTSPAAKTPERADGMGAEDMMGALTTLYPALEGTRVDQVFARARPLPADGLPVLGSAGCPGLFVACTHSGMTLAPVVADMLAQAVLGEDAAIATRYRIERFQPYAP
ncbi:MAG: FAD-dependent oxidoreductase [Pseudomonadota bacterium]